jgi:hypothetical protein
MFRRNDYIGEVGEDALLPSVHIAIDDTVYILILLAGGIFLYLY